MNHILTVCGRVKHLLFLWCASVDSLCSHSSLNTRVPNRGRIEPSQTGTCISWPTAFLSAARTHVLVLHLPAMLHHCVPHRWLCPPLVACGAGVSAVPLVQEREIEVSTFVSTASANPTVMRGPEAKAHGRNVPIRIACTTRGALAAPSRPTVCSPLCTEPAAVLRIQLMSVHMSLQLHFGRCPPRLMTALPPHCGAQAAFPASQHANHCQSSSGLGLQVPQRLWSPQPVERCSCPPVPEKMSH